MKRTLIVVLLLGVAHAAGAQTMYRWVDKDGKVHYGDKKPSDVREVQDRRMGANVVESSVPGFALREASTKYPVSLYTADNCKEPCQQARELLGKRGVPFSEITVRSPEQRDRLKQLSGDNQVPVLLVGKEMRQGYEPSMYHAALDTAGYPSAPQPGAKPANPGAAPKADASKTAPPAPPKGRYAD